MMRPKCERAVARPECSLLLSSCAYQGDHVPGPVPTSCASAHMPAAHLLPLAGACC